MRRLHRSDRFCVMMMMMMMMVSTPVLQFQIPFLNHTLFSVPFFSFEFPFSTAHHLSLQQASHVLREAYFVTVGP